MKNQRKPTFKRELTQTHIKAAARALKELETHTDPRDAQLALVMMVAYITMRFDLDIKTMPKLIEQNLQVLQGQGKLLDCLNAIHAELTEKRIFVPKGVPPIMTQGN